MDSADKEVGFIPSLEEPQKLADILTENPQGVVERLRGSEALRNKLKELLTQDKQDWFVEKRGEGAENEQVRGTFQTQVDRFVSQKDPWYRLKAHAYSRFPDDSQRAEAFFIFLKSFLADVCQIDDEIDTRDLDYKQSEGFQINLHPLVDYVQEHYDYLVRQYFGIEEPGSTEFSEDQSVDREAFDRLKEIASLADYDDPVEFIRHVVTRSRDLEQALKAAHVATGQAELEQQREILSRALDEDDLQILSLTLRLVHRQGEGPEAIASFIGDLENYGRLDAPKILAIGEQIDQLLLAKSISFEEAFLTAQQLARTRIGKEAIFNICGTDEYAEIREQRLKGNYFLLAAEAALIETGDLRSLEGFQKRFLNRLTSLEKDNSLQMEMRAAITRSLSNALELETPIAIAGRDQCQKARWELFEDTKKFLRGVQVSGEDLAELVFQGTRDSGGEFVASLNLISPSAISKEEAFTITREEAGKYYELVWNKQLEARLKRQKAVTKGYFVIPVFYDPESAVGGSIEANKVYCRIIKENWPYKKEFLPMVRERYFSALGVSLASWIEQEEKGAVALRETLDFISKELTAAKQDTSQREAIKKGLETAAQELWLAARRYNQSDFRQYNPAKTMRLLNSGLKNVFDIYPSETAVGRTVRKSIFQAMIGAGLPEGETLSEEDKDFLRSIAIGLNISEDQDIQSVIGVRKSIN